MDWFSQLPAAAPAWWGAVLSSGLAVIKGWELWRDRFRLDVGATFTCSEEIGNEIRIRNLSSKPAIITHWKIYLPDIDPMEEAETIVEKEFDGPDYIIAPHDSKSFVFLDADYFSTSPNALRGRSVFMDLHIAGRSVQRAKLYPF